MAKKQKKFRTSLLFRLIKLILRIFKRKPTIYNENDEPFLAPAILLPNHSGAAGPMDISLFFPFSFIPWGAHEMDGNYRSRWKYAYHVFYRQKMKYSKFKSFFLASLLSIINRHLYRNMRLIGTYQDIRTTKTLRESLKRIEEGERILIFPEESSAGYDAEIEKFNVGFVLLADYLLKTREIDIPLYPIYYSKKDRIISIGKKIMYKSLKDQNLSKEAIADLLRERVNEQYHKIKSGAVTTHIEVIK